jgi:hypothetical protein
MKEMRCEDDLPDCVKKEILTNWNSLEQREEKDQCFLRSVNASIHRRRDPRYVDFNSPLYKDVPTSFPVEVNTMIAFGKTNNLDMHLYEFKEKKIDGSVRAIFNSKTKGPKVFLLLHKEHVLPIRNPLKILRPGLTSSNGLYCFKCGTTFSSSTSKNKHSDICLSK